MYWIKNFRVVKIKQSVKTKFGENWSSLKLLILKINRFNDKTQQLENLV